MRRHVVVLVLLLAFALPSAALAAGGTTKAGYGGTAGNVQSAIVKAKVKPTATTRVSGTLPFTGQNLAIVAFAGLLLIGVGGMLVRNRPHGDN